MGCSLGNGSNCNAAAGEKRSTPPSFIPLLTQSGPSNPALILWHLLPGIAVPLAAPAKEKTKRWRTSKGDECQERY
jgi:hypothetical protein